MRTYSTLPRLGRVLIGVAIIAYLTPIRSVNAQPSAADPAALRETKRVATATFLDRKQPTARRLEAATNIGYPEDETFRALRAIGGDRTEDDAIRLKALQLLQWDQNYLDAVLEILNDPTDGGEELDAGLIEDLSRRLTFRLPAQDQQRIQGTFRKLLDDQRDTVRLYAYRAAVSNHDAVALSRLSDSLRRGQNFPIPLPEAIELLDQDGSANYIGALRPYLGHNDSHVQAKAARALAVDPESRPRIIELAVTASTPDEVRLNALRALAREDSKFGSYAIPLVENAREDPDVRYAAMHAFTGRMNYTTLPREEQIRFAQAVESVAADRSLTTGAGLKVKDAATRLHVYLKQAFPEIRKFYEPR